MKHLVLTLSFLSAIFGCDVTGPAGDNLITDFRLQDTSGTEAGRFHAGDEFDMLFAVTNLSGIDLGYTYTGVPVVFEIWSADTLVATSIDGMAFPQVVLGGTIRNGETFRARWRAPNTGGRIPQISLSPGSYEAGVKNRSFFDSFKAPETGRVRFSIVP